MIDAKGMTIKSIAYEGIMRYEEAQNRGDIEPGLKCFTMSQYVKVSFDRAIKEGRIKVTIPKGDPSP